MANRDGDIDDLQRLLGRTRALLHGTWTLLLGTALLLMALATGASPDPSDDFLVAGGFVAVVPLWGSHRQFASAFGRSHRSRAATASEALLYVAVVFVCAVVLFRVVEGR